MAHARARVAASETCEGRNAEGVLTAKLHRSPSDVNLRHAALGDAQRPLAVVERGNAVTEWHERVAKLVDEEIVERKGRHVDQLDQVFLVVAVIWRLAKDILWHRQQRRIVERHRRTADAGANRAEARAQLLPLAHRLEWCGNALEPPRARSLEPIKRAADSCHVRACRDRANVREDQLLRCAARALVNQPRVDTRDNEGVVGGTGHIRGGGDGGGGGGGGAGGAEQRVALLLILDAVRRPEE